MRLEAIDEPNGKTALSCLLDVPRWDFHHQEAYWLQQGVPLRRAVQVCSPAHAVLPHPRASAATSS